MATTVWCRQSLVQAPTSPLETRITRAIRCVPLSVSRARWCAIGTTICSCSIPIPRSRRRVSFVASMHAPVLLQHFTVTATATAEAEAGREEVVIVLFRVLVVLVVVSVVCGAARPTNRDSIRMDVRERWTLHSHGVASYWRGFHFSWFTEGWELARCCSR